MARREPPECRTGKPAPRIAPWYLGGALSEDGWNRGYAHPEATTLPEDARGVNWGCRCPACGASFRTTCGTEEDAATPGAPTH